MIREGTFDDIPARCGDAPACLAGVDRHGGGHAPLARSTSPSMPSSRCSPGERGRRDRRLGHTPARSGGYRRPRSGILAIAVDPVGRGKGIGSGARRGGRRAPLRHSAIRRRGPGSLDEPARTCAGDLVADSRRSPPRPCRRSTRATVDPGPRARGRRRIVPFAELDDPRAIYALDLEVSHDIPNERVRRAFARGVEGRVLALAAGRPGREPRRVRGRDESPP